MEKESKFMGCSEYPNSDSNENIALDNSATQLLPEKGSASVVVQLNESKNEDLESDSIEIETKLEEFYAGKIIQWFVVEPRKKIEKVIKENKRRASKLMKFLFVIGITCYLVAALLHNFKKAMPLLVIWILSVLYSFYSLISSSCKSSRFTQLVVDIYEKKKKYVAWASVASLIGLFGFWIVIDTLHRPSQLVSLGGYFFFLLFLLFSSKHPEKVHYRPVFGGCLIQILLAFLLLRTDVGYQFFKYLGEIVQNFINCVDNGVEFVFGSSWAQHFFAFKVLSIVIFFSSFISTLYHLGAMQWLILKIAWVMRIILRTSPPESMVAAGNIFVGQTEAPLLIAPFIENLTTSELHAVMVCGFGTVSGSVLGAYLSFGIEPVYVITACVMAAPCALAVTKLLYPETKQSKFSSPDALNMLERDSRNIIEAASSGACSAVQLVLNIAANLIAFLSLLAALNGFLEWFSSLIGPYNLNFQVLCSYIFYPVSVLIGVEPVYAKKIAELIGTKVFINEFIAYEQLSELIIKRNNGTFDLINNFTGEVNWVDEKSEAIVTYALCGFANIGSLGIMLGGLGSLAPKRQGEMANIVVRALIGGIFVSVLNACISGFLYEPKQIYCGSILLQDFKEVKLLNRLIKCCKRDNSSGIHTIATLQKCDNFLHTDGNLYD